MTSTANGADKSPNNNSINNNTPSSSTATTSTSTSLPFAAQLIRNAEFAYQAAAAHIFASTPAEKAEHDYLNSHTNTTEWNKMYLALQQAYKHPSTAAAKQGDTKQDDTSQDTSQDTTLIPDMGRLALWISYQRMNREILTQQQRGQLATLSFHWKGIAGALPNHNNQAPTGSAFDWGKHGANHSRWEYMLAKLMAYQKEFGTVKVPIRWKRDPTLGKWVSRQRDTAADLTHERGFKLNHIGFVWQCGNNTLQSRMQLEKKARQLAYAKATTTQAPPASHNKKVVDRGAHHAAANNISSTKKATAIYEELLEQERQLQQRKLIRQQLKGVRHVRNEEKGRNNFNKRRRSTTTTSNEINKARKKNGCARRVAAKIKKQKTTQVVQRKKGDTNTANGDNEEDLVARSLARAAQYNALSVLGGGAANGGAQYHKRVAAARARVLGNANQDADDDDSATTSTDSNYLADDGYIYSDNYFHLHYQQTPNDHGYEEHQQVLMEHEQRCPTTPIQGTANLPTVLVTGSADCHQARTPVVNNRQPYHLAKRCDSSSGTPMVRYGGATAGDPFSPSAKAPSSFVLSPVDGLPTTDGMTISPTRNRSQGEKYRVNDHSERKVSLPSTSLSRGHRQRSQLSPSKNEPRLTIQWHVGSSLFTPTKTTKRRKYNMPAAHADEECRSFAMACCRLANQSDADWTKKQRWTLVGK